MAITSLFRPSPALGELWLGQWQQAGLLKPSVVKPVFATLEQTLIIRRLGALQAADQVGLHDIIAKIIVDTPPKRLAMTAVLDGEAGAAMMMRNRNFVAGWYDGFCKAWACCFATVRIVYGHSPRTVRSGSK